jgi:hypothetical protein
MKRRKAKEVGNIFRRYCLLKHVTEGKTEEMIEVKGRRETKHKPLLDDLSKEGGCLNLKEKALRVHRNL